MSNIVGWSVKGELQFDRLCGCQPSRASPGGLLIRAGAKCNSEVEALNRDGAPFPANEPSLTEIVDACVWMVMWFRGSQRTHQNF